MTVRRPRELNARQRRFVAGVLAGKPAKRAYVEAGYKAGTDDAAEANATRLMGNDRVSAAVGAANADAAERAGASAEWVIAGLMAEATRHGPGASHAARVRALELLGRRLGLFNDRHEAGGPVELRAVDLARLGDADLAALDGILARAQAPAGATPEAPRTA